MPASGQGGIRLGSICGASGEGQMDRELRLGLTCLVAFSVLSALPVKAAVERSGAVNFPSDGVKEVASWTGIAVYYVDPGLNVDGVDERPIMLRYPTGRTEQVDTFTRNADVSWSPHGDWLAITNWIGSNTADCTAVTPSPSGAHKQSLASLVANDNLPSVSEDMREGDHVYLSCGRWLSPSRVEVKVQGYGCSPIPCTPRSFDHLLIYDFRTGQLSRSKRRAANKPGA